jgi:hypothetical protein
LLRIGPPQRKMQAGQISHRSTRFTTHASLTEHRE